MGLSISNPSRKPWVLSKQHAQGSRDGSVGKGRATQAWGPELGSPEPYKGRCGMCDCKPRVSVVRW